MSNYSGFGYQQPMDPSFVYSESQSHSDLTSAPLAPSSFALTGPPIPSPVPPPPPASASASSVAVTGGVPISSFADPSMGTDPYYVQMTATAPPPLPPPASSSSSSAYDYQQQQAGIAPVAVPTFSNVGNAQYTVTSFQENPIQWARVTSIALYVTSFVCIIMTLPLWLITIICAFIPIPGVAVIPVILLILATCGPCVIWLVVIGIMFKTWKKSDSATRTTGFLSLGSIGALLACVLVVILLFVAVTVIISIFAASHS